MYIYIYGISHFYKVSNGLYVDYKPRTVVSGARTSKYGPVELIPNQAAHLSIPNLREQSRKGPLKNPGQGLAVATWILDDLFKSRHPCVLSVGDSEYDYLFYRTTYMYYKLNYYKYFCQNKIISDIIVILDYITSRETSSPLD